jgi:beta-glucosidase-like glycosyl hydrolase/CubicO group peptidase (beta-lactamase class C family)
MINTLKIRSTAFLSCILFFSSIGASAQTISWDKSYPWVDSLMNTFTEDEKIAQLMTIAVWTQRDQNYEKEIEKTVADYKVGGLMFMKGGPIKQAVLSNRFQSKSKIPMLISIDGEWGLSMRLDSTPSFPRQMVLGAANNLELTRQMGAEIAKHCKRLGIHINYAPDVDINNNAANPVINDRSFGENKETVAKLGWAYAKGLQEQHILATAKHFPGHGDTETDSHHSLPVINANRKRLDSLELYPFQKLIDNGVGGVMVGHLFVPAIDTNANRATSISPSAIQGLLKNEMGFTGLVVSDGLNMKGVSNYAAPGEVCAKALQAGVDLLLFVEDVPQGIFWIKDYIKKGLISQEQLNHSCRKILITKYWAGLNKYAPIETKNLVEDLNCCSTDLLIRKIVKNGIVVAKNTDKLIPLKNPEFYKIAVVSVGSSQFTSFQQMMNNYIHADFHSIDKNDSQQAFDSLFNILQRYSLVILSMQNTSRFVSRKLGLTSLEISFVKRVLEDRRSILVNHGNPYILQHFQEARNVILAFEDLPLYNQLSAQVLMGSILANGEMPVSVLPTFKLTEGEKTQLTSRLEYVMPEEIGIDHAPLAFVDSLALEAIRIGATPGCQIFASKDGKVFYNKSFGNHTYDSAANEVKNHHLYDVASLTKILSCNLAIMKLYEEGKIKLNDKLGLYLPFLRGTSKEKITIKDVLLHEAGLLPFIPFYQKSLVNGELDTCIYRRKAEKNFSIVVADSLFIRNDYEQEIWNTIALSELKPAGNYVYSDLGFMMLRKIVEVVSHEPFETYLNNNFYKPLNLANMLFNPYKKAVNQTWIVPTENDLVFRKQTIKGYVHDPGAAMLGGISGHAGLFSNANDIGIIMQMLMNGGTYGGNRILKESTINYFTKKQNKKSRRGLGFDKPEMNALKASPAGKFSSQLCFGHTGFTGTCTWADPKNGLVYVFLSNRINPSAENKKLADTNVRTRIHDLFNEIVRKK